MYDPEFICSNCHSIYYTEASLFDVYPQIIKLKDLAQWPNEKVGYLLSKKGKEHNTLSEPLWRRKVWRAIYVTRGDIKKEKYG